MEKVWDRVRWVAAGKTESPISNTGKLSCQPLSSVPTFLLHSLCLPYFRRLFLLPYYVCNHSAVMFLTVSRLLLSFPGSHPERRSRANKNKNGQKINLERIGRPWGSFLGVGNHLPWSDPWIRGRGLATRSKLLHILNRLS